MDVEKYLKDLLEAHNHTCQAKDDRMVGIMCRREKYEQRLDDMWQTYKRGNMNQVFSYREQVKYIKDAGLEVLRMPSTGKHKIVYKR